MKERTQQLLEMHQRFLGSILDLAEIGLNPMQFKKFKKKVFESYHSSLRPSVVEILQDQPVVNQAEKGR